MAFLILFGVDFPVLEVLVVVNVLLYVSLVFLFLELRRLGKLVTSLAKVDEDMEKIEEEHHGRRSAAGA